MNLYEDAALDRKLDNLSDQAGLLLLDLLLVGLQKARTELACFQEISQANAESRNPALDERPF